MPNPEVRNEPVSAAEVIASTTDRLKRLQMEIDPKKTAGEIPSAGELARYRQEIAQLRASGPLKPDQETTVQAMEGWFAACEARPDTSAAPSADRAKEWMKTAESKLSIVRKFGTSMLKMLASFFSENSVIRKLILSDKIAYSREAEVAYLRSFPALEKIDDATLGRARDALHAKAGEIAQYRGKAYDITSLMDELTKENKNNVASIATLESQAIALAQQEKSAWEARQKQQAVAAQVPAAGAAPAQTASVPPPAGSTPAAAPAVK